MGMGTLGIGNSFTGVVCGVCGVEGGVGGDSCTMSIMRDAAVTDSTVTANPMPSTLSMAHAWRWLATATTREPWPGVSCAFWDGMAALLGVCLLGKREGGVI